MHRIANEIPKELKYAEKLVRLMDDQFKIPFLNFRFGLDPILGLVPWVGDLVSFAVSALIIKSLWDAGLPSKLIQKMVLRSLLDLGLGTIPVIGDVWDFFFKSNGRNLKLAKEFFENQNGQSGK